MMTKIQKWGHSLALRIPKSFAQQVRIDSGAEVDLAIERGGLVIRPVKPHPYRLKTLLAHINRTNLHSEVDTGAPEGREQL